MRSCLAILALLAALESAARADKLPLRVMYLGNSDTPRARAFETFLREHFAEVQVESRASFQAGSAKHVDVVLLDWSQRDSSSADAQSPLGPRDQWSTPVVLLGSAGHLLAAPWEIIGGSG